MAKIRRRRIHWNVSSDASVVGFKLYWSVSGAASYGSEFADVGNVTEVVVPDDIPSFPLVAGVMELGVTAYNEVGSESDMTRFSAHFDFTAPAPPTELMVDATDDYHIR